MTGMSRSEAPVPPSCSRDEGLLKAAATWVVRGTGLRSSVWHALCIALIPGCFYIKPLPVPYMNEAPTILRPMDNPATVSIDGDRQPLTIIAHDPDGSRIFVDWPDAAWDHISEEVLFLQGTNWVSKVMLINLDDLSDLGDPPSITAAVYDEDAGNLIDVTFLLEPQ